MHMCQDNIYKNCIYQIFPVKISKFQNLKMKSYIPKSSKPFL